MEENNENEYCTAMLETIFPLPNNYQVESYLGGGSYGHVIKCFKKDTKETVAVKVPEHGRDIIYELNVMTYLKSNQLDNCNIIRFIQAFEMKDHRVALAFEYLHMTLHDYIFTEDVLYLHDVRSVIQQMAVALNALKSKGIIHCDIKPDNIMLVDGEVQPIRVKLIDFGVAIQTVRAKTGRKYQVPEFRAPEVYLGLPVTEAIDMWSLGINMGMLLVGDYFYTGNTDYDVFRRLVELFGVPPVHLLNQGLYSQKYFIKTLCGRWRFKTPREYWGPRTKDNKKIRHKKTLPLENLNMLEAKEREECIDLLKAMLRLDPNERITPAQVLQHPFIRRGNVQHSSDSSGSSEFHGSISTSSPPHITSVQSAPPDCCFGLDEEGEQQNESCLNGSNGFDGSSATSSSRNVMYVQSEPPDCCFGLEEDGEQQNESCSNGSSEFHTPSPTTSSQHVIFVQSAPPDCCFGSDEELEQQNESCSNGSSEFYTPSPTTSSQRVIFVQSAPPDCCFGLDEEGGQQNESCSLTKLEEPSDDSPTEHPSKNESDCLYSLFLAKPCNPELTATASDDTDTKEKKKKKRKKNCFKRFCSWMKKTFCSCISVDNDQD